MFKLKGLGVVGLLIVLMGLVYLPKEVKANDDVEGKWTEDDDKTMSDYTDVGISDGKRLQVTHESVENKDNHIKFTLQQGKSYLYYHNSQYEFKVISPSGRIIDEREFSGSGTFYTRNSNEIRADESGEYTLFVKGGEGRRGYVRLEVYELFDKVEDLGKFNIKEPDDVKNENDKYFYAIRAGEGIEYEFTKTNDSSERLEYYHLDIRSMNRYVTYSPIENDFFYFDFGRMYTNMRENKLVFNSRTPIDTFAHIHEWDKYDIKDDLIVEGQTDEVYTGNLSKGKVKELKSEDRESSLVADPVDSFAGNYIDERKLMEYGGNNPINFILSYDSIANDSKDLGGGFTHNFETYLGLGKIENNQVDYYPTPNSVIKLIKENGKYLPVNNNQIGTELVETEDGYNLKDKDGNELIFNEKGEIISYSDKHKNKVEYTRGDLGELTVVKNNKGQSFEFNYNKDKGNLETVKDNIGRELNFAYEKDKLISIQLPNSDLIEIEYSPRGKVDKLTQDSQVIVENYYDTKGRITEQDDGNGNRVKFTYNENQENRLVTTINNGKSEIVKVHDTNGNLLEDVDELGNTIYYDYDTNRNVISEIDKNGNEFKYEYDSKNRLVKEVNRDNTYKTYEYDSNDNIIKLTSEDGSIVSSDYNENNQLVSMIDALGHEVTYEYDNLGNVVKVNRDDYILTNKYDSQGNLIRVNNGENIIDYEYDNIGRVIGTILPNGDKIHIEYDENSNVIKTINADGGIVTKDYNTFGDVIKETNTKGIEEIYEYDGNGNLTKESKLDRNIEYEYDVRNNLIESTIREGYSIKNTESMEYNRRGELIKLRKKDDYYDVVKYEYDNNGNLIKEDYDGRVQEYEYNRNNELIKHIDGNGNEVGYKYNDAGDLTEEIRENSKIINRYDSKGRLIEELDGEGNKTEYQYDSRGNIIKVIESNGAITQFEYNANNDITKEINALGEETINEYNELGQLMNVINDNGDIVLKYKYDSQGNVKSLTNGNGNEYKFEYDSENNVTKVIDALGNEIEENEYNEFDELVGIINSLGNKTVYERDIYGNKLREENAQGQETQYQYNELGELIRVTDDNGMNTTYGYTDTGEFESITSNRKQLTKYSRDNNLNIIKDSSSLGSIEYGYDSEDNVISHKNGRNQILNYIYNKNNKLIREETIEGIASIEYDNVGNKIKVEDNSGTIERKYDLLGRVTERTQNNKTIKYTYDNVGNITELEYPNGNKVKYSYDNVGNILKVSDWNGNDTKYEYDKNERLVKTVNSNGVEEYREYDREGQLTEIKRVKDGSEIDTLEYTYDSLGNIIEEDGKLNRYDNLNRLIESGSNTYRYDNSGNIVEYNLNSEGTSSKHQLDYGNSNEITRLDSLAVQVDSSGNLETYTLNGDKLSATYDSKNHLTSFDGTTYDYDSEGNRVGIGLSESKEISYVIDDVTSEYSQVIVETDSDSNSKYHIYGNGLIGTYDSEDNGSFKTNHYDIRGSTVSVSDDTGKIIGEVSYDEYGVILDKSESIETSYLYNGQFGVQTDSNGLYYMRNRYYNPSLKRFMNRDILLGEFDQTQTLNRYSYVNGNPISYIDPFGLARESIADKDTGQLRDFQTLLDIGGFIPVAGIAFDGLNSVTYLVTGDYENAVMSGIGAVPIVGDGVSAVRKGSKVSSAVNKKSKYKRIPKTRGKWDGEPGNSKWYSDRPEVNEVTKGEPVEFIEGRPDFSPWSSLDLKFEPGQLDGSNKDFSTVHRKLKEEYGFKTQSSAEKWMKKEGLTAHHEDLNTVQLVPSNLNNKIPHIGGASDLRGGNRR